MLVCDAFKGAKGAPPWDAGLNGDCLTADMLWFGGLKMTLRLLGWSALREAVEVGGIGAWLTMGVVWSKKPSWNI